VIEPGCAIAAHFTLRARVGSGAREPLCRGCRIFDGHVAVWLPAVPGVQAALIEEAPQIYFRPPYVGPAGWVGVELSKVDDAQLGSLIREAFHLMVAKDSAGSRKPSRRRRTTNGV
jgi:hypothetical protein